MTTTAKVGMAPMKAQDGHSKRVGVTRKKWGLDEELLLLRLFKVYNRSWSQYVAYYPGRNAASIRNKYYTLARRGDAYNRAIYGTVALNSEHIEASSGPQDPKSSTTSVQKRCAAGGNILDLSVIGYKNVQTREETPNNTPNCLTPDATDAFLGSEYTNGGISGTLPGLDYHDAISLERTSSSSSDNGVVTPPLLIEHDFLLGNFSFDDSIQSPHTSSKKPPARSDIRPDRPGPTGYPLLGRVQPGHYNNLDVMFTFPFQAIPYKNFHPLITHTFPVLPPMFHPGPLQSLQHPHSFGVLPSVGFPFSV